jgi:predicted O-methyltransferase YrrM
MNAHSQTNPEELACLAKHASGRKLALEIGTHMGVSGVRIAKALGPGGKLFCVDPWELRSGKENPCFSICKREMHRNNVASTVVLVQGLSHEVEHSLPASFDFIFVDGDHTYSGIKRDWEIVLRRLSAKGIACFHDTSVPAAEPYRRPESVNFFNDVIQHHPEFRLVECRYSMNVVERL